MKIVVILLLLLSFTYPVMADDKQYAEKWITDHFANKAPKRYKAMFTKRYVSNIATAVVYQSKKHHIGTLALLKLIANESSFRYNARSKKGAIGLMQVRAIDHGDKIKGRSLHNVNTNIEVGTQILKDCINNSYSQAGAMNCYMGLRYRKRKS